MSERVEQPQSMNSAATQVNKHPEASNSGGPADEVAAGAELRPKPADSAQSPQTNKERKNKYFLMNESAAERCLPRVNVAGSANQQREGRSDKAKDNTISLDSPAATISCKDTQLPRASTVRGWSPSGRQSTDGSAHQLAERGGAKPVQGFYTANNEHKPKGEEHSLIGGGDLILPLPHVLHVTTQVLLFLKAELPVSSRLRLNDVTLVFTFSSFPFCSFLSLHEKNPDDVTQQRLQTLSKISFLRRP